ncbi:MAG TPA: prolipoprotein diacylglyceryl transferase [Terriglobales bacterium]|nr:prolipoprotein diacylglyceryl transferase [Terriglobales bacterium]
MQVGPLRLGTYGLMVWLAFFFAYFVLSANMRRRNMPGDPLNIILLLVVAGLAGSKLYHLLERPAEFFSNPIGLFFSSYGFAWFGGFLGGLAVLLWLAHHYRVPILAFLDACSPVAALGYAIGRIGCLLSGDGDYGIATNLPWGMAFPPLEAGCRVHHFVCAIHGSLEPSYGTTVGLATHAIVRVHPTPIYEFIVGVLIACFLWRRSTQRLRDKATPGEILAEYLVLTGLARFLVEFIRINPRSAFGVLTNAQVVSLLSIVAGVVLIFVVRARAAADTARRRVADQAAKH